MATPELQVLQNVVQPYAWGSRTALAQLQGRPASPTPEAELWMGAHPVAPSRTAAGASLIDHLAAAPERHLGPRVLHRFGPQLPFLFKVLAAAEPLSLQAHPSLAQARAGFAREDAAGIDRGAAHRNYRDPNHKPEIICALTPFEALCGFRAQGETVRILEALGLTPTTLRTRGLKAYFGELMGAPRGDREALVAQLVAGAARRPVGLEKECGLVERLHAKYPGDIGVLGALLLNHLTLQPGEALYLGAGNLHAYLEGLGVELMANSDNVLRGGLTPKHVDVNELLSVLEFTDGPPQVLRPRGAPEGVYETPIDDFRLSRITLGGSLTLDAGLPQILLCTEGRCTVGGHGVSSGQSIFVSADTAAELHGEATLFRATAGL